MEKYGFIYITTNKLNNMKYIGQRKYYGSWKSYLGSGKYIKNAIKYYGKDNFIREIISECDTKKELDKEEIYYIKKYNAVDSRDFYNFKKGGEGGNGMLGNLHPLYGVTPKNANNKIVICENIKSGVKVEFSNLTKFSDKNGFDRSKISSILLGYRGRKSHKGNLFYYKNNKKPKNYENQYNIIQKNITTNEKRIIDNVAKFCRENKLDKSCIYGCLKSKSKQYNGCFYYRENEECPIIVKVYKVAIDLSNDKVFMFNNTKNFASKYNFSQTNIDLCLRGDRKSRIHKNFKFLRREEIDETIMSQADYFD